MTARCTSTCARASRSSHGRQAIKRSARTSARIRAAAACAPPRFSRPRAVADDRVLLPPRGAIVEERAGVFVVGPAALADAALRAPLLALAQTTGYPILAEATSQLAGDGVIVGGLSLLARERRARALRPRLVVQIGAVPVNASLPRLLDHPSSPHLEILSTVLDADAESRAAAVVVGDPTRPCHRAGHAARGAGVVS